MAVRPSKVELLKNVSPEKLDQPCKDGDLIKLSHSITDWEYIACLLGLTNPEIQAIKTNSNSEECRRIMMLRTWNGKYNFKATYRSLIDIFYTYELTDLVTKVCDDINIQRSNTSGRSVINPNEPTPRQKTPLQSLQGSQRKRKWHHDQPSPTLDSSLQLSGQQMPPSHVSNSPLSSSLPFPAPSLPLPIEHAVTSRTPHDCSSTGGSASQSTPHQTHPHPPMPGTQAAASPNSFTHERYRHPGRLAFPQHHSYQMPLAPIPSQQTPPYSLQGSQREHKPSPTLDNSLQMSGQQMPSHSSNSSFFRTSAPNLPLPSEHANSSPPSSSLPTPAPSLPLLFPPHQAPFFPCYPNTGIPAFYGLPYQVPFQMHSTASDSSMAVNSQKRHQATFGLFPPSSLPSSAPTPSLPLPIEHAATSRTPHDCSSTGGSASQSTLHQTHPHPPMPGTQAAVSPNSLAHERYCHPGEIGRLAFTQHHSYQTPLAPIPRQQNPPHSLQGSQREHKPSPTLDSSLQMSVQQIPSHSSNSSFFPTPAPNLPLPSERANSSPPSSSLPTPAPSLPLLFPPHQAPFSPCYPNTGIPAFYGLPYQVPFQMHSAASDSSMAVNSQKRHQATFGLIPPSSLPSSAPTPSLPRPIEHAATSRTPHGCSSTGGSASQFTPHQTHPHPPIPGTQITTTPKSFTHETYRHPGRPAFPQHHSYQTPPAPSYPIPGTALPGYHSYHTPDMHTFLTSPYHDQRLYQMPLQSPPIASVSSLPRQRHHTPIRPSFPQHSPMSGYQLTVNTHQFACDSHGLADTHALQPHLFQEPHSSHSTEAPHLHPDQARGIFTSHPSVPTTSTGYPQPRHQGQIPIPFLRYVLNVFPTIAPKSPILQSYANYLQQRYQTHIPSFFTLDWPPPPTCKFFNLSMIQQQRFEYGSATEELTRLMLRGDVRGVLCKKREVKLEKICSLDRKPRKVILIEGAPGAGKSTLAWHIVQKRQLGEMFQEFDIVIYVQLRDPAIQAAQSLADILPARSKAGAVEVASELEACDGNRTLFVIDSWDEYPPGLNLDSFFKTLICEPATLSMHLSTLIITSRPIATGDLQRFTSSRVEIVGFTPDEAKQYFTEALGDSQSVERLQDHLQERPVIEASCYLPLNAAIVAHLFLVNQSLPTTLHGVFTSMVICCIIRHMKKKAGEGNQQQVPRIHSLDKLPSSIEGQFRNICALAYHGVKENKATFSSEDLEQFHLPTNLSTLSLIQGTESITYFERSVLYNFLHLSIQELLAAFHISKMPPSEQVEIFEEMFGQPRFSAVFQFYAAFTKLQTEGIREIVSTIVNDYDKYQLLSLLHCLYEAQDPSLCKFVASELNGKLHLPYTILSPVDCLAVGYFLSEVCLTTSGEFKVDLQQCLLDDYNVNLLVKSLTQCHRIRDVHVQQATDTETPGSLEIYLCNNDIQYEGAHSFAELLSSSNMISKLDLSQNKIQEGGDGLIDLCKALMTNTSLTELVLGYEESVFPGHYVTITESNGPVMSEMLKANRTLKVLCLAKEKGVSDTGAFHIAEGLKYNTGLEQLDLCWCDITSKGAEFLADALTVNKQLRVLDLSGIHIGETPECLEMDLCDNEIQYEGAHSFAELLNSSNIISRLDLSQNAIQEGGDGLIVLCKALMTNTSLTELRLGYEKSVSPRYNVTITESNGPVLSEMLKANRTLKVLCLAKERGVSDTGAFHIAEGLKYNTGLEKLDLSWCDITSKGAEFLADALTVNKQLRVLDLSENHLDDSGVSHISNALKTNTSLKHLDLQDCEISEKGAETLGSALAVNTTLETLDLRENPISDCGVSQLAEALRHNHTLKELNIRDCGVTDHGMKSLASILKVNTSLKMLDLSENVFTDSGLKALGESLRHNRGLEKLTLEVLRCVTVEGWKEFAPSLQANSHLKEFSVCITGGGASEGRDSNSESERRNQEERST